MLFNKGRFYSAAMIYLRGIAMGAADVVPGVSGGTIAFITGIYQRLLLAIRNIGTLDTLLELKSLQFSRLWARVDANFLLILFAGVFTSLFSLAKVINEMLDSYPLPLWSGFFGLVMASALVLFKDVKGFKLSDLTFLILFILLGFSISTMAPSEWGDQPFHFFFAGMIAICAMILPGISGSLILLLMGMYGPVISAIESFQLGVLTLFLLGNGLGLLAFSHVLTWTFKHFERQTLVSLIGLMLGSLVKLWPWKQVLETHENRHGELVPLVQKNVLPETYAQVTQQPDHLLVCCLAMCIGLSLVFFIRWLSLARRVIS